MFQAESSQQEKVQQRVFSDKKKIKFQEVFIQEYEDLEAAEKYDFQIKEIKKKRIGQLSFLSQFYEERQRKILEEYYESHQEYWKDQKFSTTDDHQQAQNIEEIPPQIKPQIQKLQEKAKGKKEAKQREFKEEKQKLTKAKSENLKKKKIKSFEVKVSEEIKNQIQDFLRSSEHLFSNIDKLYEKYPSELILYLRNGLQEQSESELLQTQVIKQQLENRLQLSDYNDDCAILLGLHQMYQQLNGNVILLKKSNIWSKISMKILFSQFLNQLTQFQERIEGQSFEIFQESQDQLYQFIDKFKSKKSKEYKIKKDSIIVSKLVEGSIKIFWTSLSPADTYKVLFADNQRQEEKKLILHPYFQHFKLSRQDFDHRFSMSFRDRYKRQWRGDWFYYLPVWCKRYSLKVLNLYDQTDQWIKDENQGWAISFHGVCYPWHKLEGEKTILHSIMSGKHQGTMLEAGTDQKYQKKPAINKSQDNVEVGIYCSPHLYECQNYSFPFQVLGKSYRLVLQCRVNPDAIKVCPKQTYWVINQSKDIRPYGIILIKEENFEKIYKSRQRYGKFTWNEQKEARLDERKTKKC